MRKIRDWIFTVPFLLAFGLSLGVFDIVGRVVRPFSLRGFEYVMATLQRTLMATFRICGAKVIIERSPLIKSRHGYAVISNHQSLFDIAMIGGILFSNFPKYVAKKELGRGIPSISLNLKHGGNTLIDRKDRLGSMEKISAMARTAQERNVSVVIFPEGTRSRDGNLLKFRRAGSQALLEAANRLEAVPVAIDGSWKLLENNAFPVPFGTHIRIRFGDPMPREDGDAGEITKKAEAWISETLDEWRS